MNVTNTCWLNLYHILDRWRRKPCLKPIIEKLTAAHSNSTPFFSISRIMSENFETGVRNKSFV